MCLGLHTDTEGNVMDVIWAYGGKLVEADDKTVALNSPGTVQAVKVIADMYRKHKIIPKGAISWDNQGNNKAYQSRQVIFVVNASSIYAHLSESDKELYDVTGMLPAPGGPAGPSDRVSTEEYFLFKHNPYPEVAKGLVQYYMDPENLRVVMEEGGGRWGPPYKGMYDRPSGRSPGSSIGVRYSTAGACFPPLAVWVLRRVRCMPPLCWPVWCTGCLWITGRPRRPSRKRTTRWWRSTRGGRRGRRC